jgi:glycosyltransferase involved in cell wall biosynthesis
MKICLFDHHNNPYPIQGYGGIERINQLLFTELSLNDYNVTLICVEGSDLSFKNKNSKLITLPFKELENIRNGKIPISKYFNGDIFHTHTSSTKYSNFNFEGFNGKWLATCHGYIEWAGAKYQSFVSENQYQQHIRDGLIENTTEYVYITPGCIESNNLKYIDGDHNRIIWLGRICSDKGIDRLIEIADKLNEPILVAGVNHDTVLFNKLLNSKNIEYFGTINSEQEKALFFSQAKMSLHTSTFEDPFPLTILEAQMCGIPVVTWANGSVTESNYSLKNIHTSLDSITSYINSNEYEMFNKIEISDWCKNNFSGKNLLHNFTEVYKSILLN